MQIEIIASDPLSLTQRLREYKQLHEGLYTMGRKLADGYRVVTLRQGTVVLLYSSVDKCQSLVGCSFRDPSSLTCSLQASFLLTSRLDLACSTAAFGDWSPFH